MLKNIKNLALALCLLAPIAAKAQQVGPAVGPGVIPGIAAGTSSFVVARSSAALTSVTGDSTDYIVAFDEIITDRNNDYNTTTFTYTVPRTGSYMLCAQTQMQNLTTATATSVLLYALNSSGSAYTLFYEAPSIILADTSGTQIAHGCQVVSLTAAQTLKLHLLVAGSSKVVTIARSGTASSFQIEFLN